MKQTLFYITLIILTISHASLALAWRHVSPYAYCAGDPVNKVDPDGKVAVASNLEQIMACSNCLSLKVDLE